MTHEFNGRNSEPMPSVCLPNKIKSFVDKRPRENSLGNIDQNHQAYSTDPSCISALLNIIRCFSPEIRSAVTDELEQFRRKNFDAREERLRLKPDPNTTNQTPKNKVRLSSDTLFPHSKSFPTSPSSVMLDAEDTLTQEIRNKGYRCPVEFINESSEKIKKMRLENPKHVTNWRKLERKDSKLVNALLKACNEIRQEDRKRKKSANEHHDTHSSSTKVLSKEENEKVEEKKKKIRTIKINAMETQLSKEYKSNVNEISIKTLSVIERNEQILLDIIASQDKQIQELRESNAEREN